MGHLSASTAHARGVYSYEVSPGGSTSGTRLVMKRVESGSMRLVRVRVRVRFRVRVRIRVRVRVRVRVGVSVSVRVGVESGITRRMRARVFQPSSLATRDQRTWYAAARVRRVRIVGKSKYSHRRSGVIVSGVIVSGVIVSGVIVSGSGVIVSTLYAAATGSQAAEAAAPAALTVTSLTTATPTPTHTKLSARARAVESVCP